MSLLKIPLVDITGPVSKREKYAHQILNLASTFIIYILNTLFILSHCAEWPQDFSVNYVQITPVIPLLTVSLFLLSSNG